MDYETSIRFRHASDAQDAAETQFRLAISHAKTGHFSDAAEAFRRVLDLIPDRTDAWQGLGYCYRKLRAFAQANEAYGEAQRLDPSRGAMWFNAPVAAIGMH
ncbi:tetratricopeptide repeat protein [Niveibacterium sp. 24ML]|uniref:tetratricopeptide repeat protein n=1 Tax=Niveibacterium sp. 24ML TaxID=2985512 RepID=UPI00226E94FB|nr:tetratricopeptide repeat protein [Niveibacterium sp. 24ML]MCX9157196.1 tetratricopeptide repeat protein [Niveibacterium sp. 24ML]